MNFSKFYETVAWNSYFTSLAQSLGTDMHKHFISQIMLMRVFPPWQSFLAGFGKLHFWSPLLKAATSAWWCQKSAARVPRGQIWRASGNFAWWGACWRARCISGERSAGTAPVSGTEPFVSLLSMDRIQIPPNVAGVHVWTSSVGMGWFECFPPSEGDHGTLGWLCLPLVVEKPLCHGAQPRRFSTPFCRQNIWLWESLPKICRCSLLKTL